VATNTTAVTDQPGADPGGKGGSAPAQIRPPRDVRGLIVKYGFIVVTIGFFVYFSATLEAFRLSATMFSMLKYTPVVAIAGLGVTTTMVVGGLDLSVGATAGAAVTVAAMTMVFYSQTGGMAITFVLLAGAAIGAVNALLIVVLKIPDLLSTLAVMFLVSGLKLVPVDGQSVSSGIIRHDGAVAPGLLLSRTKWGRVMYAIGSNPEAARLAGARVGRYKAFAYILSGVFASVAGLILASRIGQGDISAGNSLLLDAVAVALVGTSVLGVNKPNAFGTTLGALLIGILLTGTTMMNFQYYWQDVVKGLVLLVALVFSFTMSLKKQRFVAAVQL